MRYEYGVAFWLVTVGLIPVFLDLVLGMVLGYFNRNVAAGASGNSTAFAAVLLAWPLLAALATLAAQRWGRFRTVGVTAKQIYWSGFGLIMAASVVWSPFVALAVWAVFPGAD